MITNSRLHSFIGGLEGRWLVTGSSAIIGEALPPVARLDYQPGDAFHSAGGGWSLRGVTSHDR